MKCVTVFNTNVTLRLSMRYSVPGVEWKKISCPRLALPSPISVAAMVVVSLPSLVDWFKLEVPGRFL